MPVTIENEHLSLEVHPSFGGKVSSLVDKADHFDLLFTYPAELPLDQPVYDKPYANSWVAGWDECFPAVAPSRYAGYPYDGISVPDHGEIWGVPTTAVPTKNGITTVWHGLRFGYRLTRKLYVEGPECVAEYTLVNLAPFTFRYVWAHHALLSTRSAAEIDLPGVSGCRLSHDGVGHRFDKPATWPTVDGVDLARPASLPPARAWKVFATDPISRPATVRYPQRGRSLTLTYASEDNTPAYWGIWVNTGGWAQHTHFSLQPTTGRYDQLDRSTWDDSAARLGPLGKTAWQVRLAVAPL